MDDIVCIRKCLAGKKEAYEPLVAKYKNLVFSLALRTLVNKNDASDATQEVFLRAWANLARYNPDFSFKTWIAKITINYCINLNQKNKRITVWDDEEMGRMPSGEGLPEEIALINEKGSIVQKAVDSLPDMYRIVIQLFHHDQMSYDEICKITDEPMTIVKNRLYRARKMLADKLKPYFEENCEWRENNGLR